MREGMKREEENKEERGQARLDDSVEDGKENRERPRDWRRMRIGLARENT